MKLILISVLLILAGCASGPTFEELQAEALITGDWSEVERREALKERRRQRQGPQCPSGYFSYCTQQLSLMRCTCVASNAFARTWRR